MRVSVLVCESYVARDMEREREMVREGEEDRRMGRFMISGIVHCSEAIVNTNKRGAISIESRVGQRLHPGSADYYVTPGCNRIRPLEK